MVRKATGFLLLIIIWIILIFKFLDNNKEISYKTVNLSKSTYVLNRTSNKFLDTLVKIGLDELKVDKALILIQDLEETYVGNYKISAYIVDKGGDLYIIYIKKGISKREAITIISHELIHLLQYQNKELEMIENYVIWKGDTISNHLIPPYLYRPWEYQAYVISPALELIILNKLSKK